MKRILFLLLFFILNLPCSFAQNDSIAASVRGDALHAKTDDSNLGERRLTSDLKSKYSGTDFDYEPKKREKSFWERVEQWLTELFSKLFGISSKISGKAVNVVLWIIASIAIVLAVYMIAKSILRKEGRWIFGSSSRKIIDPIEIEKNLKNTDFESLIAKTLQSGDKRLAVRYYYLWLLKKLAERGFIEWNPEKTNSDYYYEIKSEQVRQDFKYVSYLYDYIWYGEFNPDDATFASTQNRFEKTIHSIR